MFQSSELFDISCNVKLPFLNRTETKGFSKRFKCSVLNTAIVKYANYEYLYIFLGFNYVELNLRSLNWYRSYNKNIPEWLHNRPKKYVKHCLEKRELAKEVNTKNQFKSEELQTFTITSLANPEKFYEVYLGDDLRIPSCQCF